MHGESKIKIESEHEKNVPLQPIRPINIPDMKVEHEVVMDSSNHQPNLTAASNQGQKIKDEEGDEHFFENSPEVNIRG